MVEERNVSLKNYIILAVILILSVILVIYFYIWYNEFELSKNHTPIMNEYFNVINYNELEEYLIENKNVILYVSVLDDKTTRSFENKLKNVLDDYSFNNDILYMDLTGIKHNNDLYKSIINRYNLVDLPYLIIFNNGNVVDTYNVVDNNYDVELLVSYLRIKGVLDD